MSDERFVPDEKDEHFRVTVTFSQEREGVSSDYKIVADSGNERDGGKVYSDVKRPSVKHESVDVLDVRVAPGHFDINRLIAALFPDTRRTEGG